MPPKKKSPSTADSAAPSKASLAAAALRDRMNDDQRNLFVKGAKDKARARRIYDAAPAVRNPGQRPGRAPEETIIRTGSQALDLAIGIGGVPRGKLTLIYGEYSSGKTQLALHIARSVSKGGEVAIYLDAEGTVNDNLLLRVGAIPENVIIWRPRTVEQAIHQLTGKGGYFEEFGDAIGAVIIDSIPMLPTDKELEVAQSESDRMMMDKPRVWTERLQPLVNSCADNGIALVALNQLRDDGTDFMGNPKYRLPGGKVWGFIPSLYIKTSKAASTDTSDKSGEENKASRKAGQGISVHITRFDIEKNKVGTPYRRGFVSFRPGRAYPHYRDILSTALHDFFYGDFGSVVFLKDTKFDEKTKELSGTSNTFTLVLTDVLKKAVQEELADIERENIGLDLEDDDYFSPFDLNKFLDNGYWSFRFKSGVMKKLLDYPKLVDAIGESMRDGLDKVNGYHGVVGVPDSGEKEGRQGGGGQADEPTVDEGELSVDFD